MTFNKKIVKDSLLGLLLGGGLMYLGFALGSSKMFSKFLPEGETSLLVFFPTVFLAPFLAIALHELGHLLAGLLQGFRLELFVVGFLGIRREGNKTKVYFNTNFQYFGGVAATSPRQKLPDEQLIRAYKFIVLAGPITSLVFCVIPFTVFYLTETLLNPFWALLGGSSFGIFLATTLPNKTGIFFTDRKRFQRLNNQGEVGKIELAFLQILNQSLLDGHCKNIPLPNIEIVKKDTDQVIQFWGYYFEYQHYKDSEQTDKLPQSKAQLQPYKPVIPDSLWKSLNIS